MMEQLKCKKMCDEWEYTEVYSFYEFRGMNVCCLQVKQLKRIRYYSNRTFTRRKIKREQDIK